MAKKDYAQICTDIINVCGGEGNITNVTHCMTRLRVQLRDESKINKVEAKAISGVMNLIVQSGEYQFIIGQDVPSLFEEFKKHDGIKIGGSIQDDAAVKQDMKDKKSNILSTIMGFIGGTFSPVIPVLIAGGLTGAVLTLLTTFFGVSNTDGTYVVLYAINQATFYFLPIFIGFSAANKLGSNGYLGAFLAAIMLFSTINNAEGLSFLGIKIQQIAYNSTVFPVILGVLFMSVVYKFLQRHTPVYLRTIFVPLITILITVPVTLIVLGPIGNTFGTWLADGVLAIYRAVPAIAVMIIGIATPLMVFFGMNNATYPVLFLLIAEIGSDPLICTGMAPANVAVGGACLAAALIAKNAEDKSIATGAGITALCGITEPGVYGVLFVKKYPLIGAMIGGGIGGLLAGLLGMTQYVVSTPGFISIPAYINPDGTGRNLIVSIIVMVLAVAVSFLVTFFLGKREEKKRAIKA
ncbi:PTS transporter subunit EIIC [Konateibacter massiliensis]|uniref:PTS transporter subunit EIIC n=1 Tax=Konateibacter massiliensis TaxID=2002841 RepID=UPI000C15CF20|nr:PTS transporter subunit EIIC [Konateibacter massiliensis]